MVLVWEVTVGLVWCEVRGLVLRYFVAPKLAVHVWIGEVCCCYAFAGLKLLVVVICFGVCGKFGSACVDLVVGGWCFCILFS